VGAEGFEYGEAVDSVEVPVEKHGLGRVRDQAFYRVLSAFDEKAIAKL